MNTETQTVVGQAPVTQQALEGISYGALQAKFQELQIPNAWKPGTKKAVLIEGALAMLEDLKQAKADGKTIEQVDQEKALKVAQDEAETQAQAILKQAEIDVEQQAEIERPSLSKEIIERNLNAIEVGMRYATLIQKAILVKKQNNLNDMLKAYK